jgi:hypothetical protein
VKRGLWAAALLLLCGTSASAQSLEKVTLNWDNRYDTVDFGDTKNRFQGAVRARFVIDIEDTVDLIGKISTGTGYTSRWATLHDLKDPDRDNDFRLHFRQLYLESTFDVGPLEVRAQGGAIPPIKNVASSTGIESDGWIDGGRIEFRGAASILELVAGSLTDLETPNVFSRDREANYLEAELTSEVGTGWVVEASGERIDGDHYTRGEVRHAADDWLGPLQLSAEGLLNIERSSVIAGATAATDALAWGSPALKGRLKVTLNYTYIGEDPGLRGSVIDDFTQEGHTGTLRLKGAISKSRGIGWFARYIQSEAPRVTAGIAVKLSR